MKKDYAKAARASQQKQTKRLSRGFWLFFVLLLSALIGLIVLLEKGRQAGEAPSPEAPKQQKAAKPEEKPIDAPVEKPPEVEFDFYTELAKNPEISEQAIQPATGVRNSAYFLQVSSVGHLSELERMKSRLELLGFTVGSRPFTYHGKTWYQVNVGPFDTLVQAHGAQNELRKHQFDGILRRGQAK